MKRQANENGGVSPPPVKRKLESTTTNKAVANFFTPQSQKTVEPVLWRTVHDTLLVGHFKDSKTERSSKRRKIAAFDLDSTLITTSSGKVFGKDANDWRWLDNKIPSMLKRLYEDGYRVVIISNQGGIKLETTTKLSKSEADRLSIFKEKVGYVFNQLDFPIGIYAATGKDHFRKPRVGMWKEFLEDYDFDEGLGPDLKNSFFVGDAGGRVATPERKADHSCTDRNFAENVGIKFDTPEGYFLEEEPLKYEQTFFPMEYRAHRDDAVTLFAKKNAVDIVLLVGSPGAGKSTFYHRSLKPLGYERINQDILKSRGKCLQVAAAELAQGKSVAIDNTNADISTRAHWIELAERMKVPIRCMHLDTPLEACRHNDIVRALHSGNAAFNPEKRDMLPLMAFVGYRKRFELPKLEEGFQDVVRLPFRWRGDDESWHVWSQYWL